MGGAMKKKPQITMETINQAVQHRAVRQALNARARIILPRAQGLASKAGAHQFAKRLHIEEGTRSGAKSSIGIERPYARVTADIDEVLKKADSRSTMTRLRIMRQAGR